MLASMHVNGLNSTKSAVHSGLLPPDKGLAAYLVKSGQAAMKISLRSTVTACSRHGEIPEGSNALLGVLAPQTVNMSARTSGAVTDVFTAAVWTETLLNSSFPFASHGGH